MADHQRIHLSYMKETLSVQRSSSTNAIYAEFGRCSLIIKQEVQVLKQWQRFLLLPHEHVLKQPYSYLKQIHEFSQRNWCNYVCELLAETEVQESWESVI